MWEGGLARVDLALFATLALIVTVTLSGAVRAKTAFSNRAVDKTQAESRLGSAMERIGFDVRRSAHARIVIDASEPDADSLRLQIRDEAAPGRFGAEDEQLEFREDWCIRYALRGGTLFRESLDSLGNPRFAEPILTDIDAACRGEKGFSVRRWKSLYTVTIRILERDRTDSPKRRSCTMSFAAGD